MVRGVNLKALLEKIKKKSVYITKRTAIAIISALLILAVAETLPVYAAEDSWASKAPMPTARHTLGVAVVNRKIYAIGGGANGSYLATNEMYDPATDTWSTKAPMPTPRYSSGISVYQNKIFVIGGWISSDSCTGVNEVYDPQTDTWETKTPMPTTPRTAISANVIEGKIYVIEYSNKSKVMNVYDPASDTWTTKTQIPNFPYEPYATATSVVVDDEIYFIASFMSQDHIQYSNQVYALKTDTWSRKALLPTYVGVAGGAATIGAWAPKRIYVLGGWRNFVSVDFNQIYDPASDTWSRGSPMPTSRYSLSVAVVDDILYAIGGIHRPDLNKVLPSAGVTGANEQYKPIGYAGPIQPSPPMGTTSPSPRSSTSFAPSQEPIKTPKAETLQMEPLPETWLIASIIIGAVVCAALLFYFKKRKH